MVPVPAFSKVFGICIAYAVVSNHASGERLSDDRLPSHNAFGRRADDPVFETSADSLIVSGSPGAKRGYAGEQPPASDQVESAGAAVSNRRPCPNGKS